MALHQPYLKFCVVYLWLHHLVSQRRNRKKVGPKHHHQVKDLLLFMVVRGFNLLVFQVGDELSEQLDQRQLWKGKSLNTVNHDLFLLFLHHLCFFLHLVHISFCSHVPRVPFVLIHSWDEEVGLLNDVLVDPHLLEVLLTVVRNIQHEGDDLGLTQVIRYQSLKHISLLKPCQEPFNKLTVLRS